MGFDKPGEVPLRIQVSDTQAYKQFGNSVAVPVVEAIARHMQPWLEEDATVKPSPGRAEIFADA